METVFITGSSRGIGYTLGMYLIKKNYNVIFNGRGDNNINDICNYIKGDVNEKSLLETVITNYSKIDILINNAGVLIPDNSEDVNEEIHTNLISCVNFCKQAEQLGIKKVINITSGSAINCPKDISLYGWSKYALEGLTKFLANKGSCSFTNLRVDVSLKTNMTENYYKNSKLTLKPELKSIDIILPCFIMIIKMPRDECNGRTFSLQRFLESPKLEKLFGSNSILSKKIHLSAKEISNRENTIGDFNKCIGDNPNGNPYPSNQKVEHVTNELANHLEIGNNQVLITNGGISTSVDLISKVFINQGDKILSLGILFPPLMTSFVGMGGTLDFVQLNANPPSSNKNHKASISINLELITKKFKEDIYKILYITNPFYLTGKVLNKEEFNDIMSIVPKNVLVIIDECYIEYVYNNNNNISNMVDIIKTGKYKNYNIIGLRTFSKFYGLGDIRAGFVISNEHIIELLSYNIPWKNMPGGSLDCISKRIKEEDFLKDSFENNKKGRNFIQKELEKLKLNYIPSESNTVCIQIPNEMSLENFCKVCKKECNILLPSESILEGTFIYQIGTDIFNKSLVRLLKKLN